MRLGQDGSVARLARELGVSEPTLTKWLRPPAVPGLRPVAVMPAPTPGRAGVASPMLITPKGVRVRGLDRDTLVAVLQALGCRLDPPGHGLGYGAPADLRKGFDGLSGLVS